MALSSLIDDRMEEIGAALGVRGHDRARVLAEIRAHLEDPPMPPSPVGSRPTRRSGGRSTNSGIHGNWRRASAPRPRPAPGEARSPWRSASASPTAPCGFRASCTPTTARLGSSVPYTMAWATGWASLLLIASPVIALLVHHGRRLGTAALAAMLRRARLLPWWPTVLVGTGEALVAAHDLVLEERADVAVATGMVLVAVGVTVFAVLLARERPLA